MAPPLESDVKIKRLPLWTFPVFAIVGLFFLAFSSGPLFQLLPGRIFVFLSGLYLCVGNQVPAAHRSWGKAVLTPTLTAWAAGLAATALPYIGISLNIVTLSQYTAILGVGLYFGVLTRPSVPRIACLGLTAFLLSMFFQSLLRDNILEATAMSYSTGVSSEQKATEGRVLNAFLELSCLLPLMGLMHFPGLTDQAARSKDPGDDAVDEPKLTQ